MSDSRKWWLPRLVLVFAIGAVVAGVYLSGLNHHLSVHRLKENLTDLQHLVNDHWPYSLLVYFIIYVVATSLSLPTGIWLSLLGGALFGRWVGTLTADLAATVGATFAMLASRYLFRDWVQRMFGPRLVGLNRRIEQDGAYYLLTLRLIPGLPFWLVNLGMGITNMRSRTYAIVSFFGMMPVTFLVTNAGTELAKIESWQDVFSREVLGALLLIALLPLLVKFIIGRLANRTA